MSFLVKSMVLSCKGLYIVTLTSQQFPSNKTTMFIEGSMGREV